MKHKKQTNDNNNNKIHLFKYVVLTSSNAALYLAQEKVAIDS